MFHDGSGRTWRHTHARAVVPHSLSCCTCAADEGPGSQRLAAQLLVCAGSNQARSTAELVRAPELDIAVGGPEAPRVLGVVSADARARVPHSRPVGLLARAARRPGPGPWTPSASNPDVGSSYRLILGVFALLSAISNAIAGRTSIARWGGPVSQSRPPMSGILR